MPKTPKTKIVATLGPASSASGVLRKMFISGLDIVRLNFSHGSHAEHLNRIKLVRKLNKKLRRSIKIMQDLEGYRIRVGKLKNPILLKKNMKMFFTQNHKAQNEKQIPFDYDGSLTVIKPGVFIYADDGKIVFKVESARKDCLAVKVIVGGMLKPSKGINIPGIKLDFDSVTDKDKTDLKVAVAEKLDYLAQSFANKPEDVEIIKKLILPKHPACKIFAKIESQQALKNLDSIIDASDGIIVARGDLGICVPIYKVPVIQKEIIKKCNLKKKPVIVATEMLDSMTENPRPTRAEVCDVANAILDGATHLMLSAETTIGRYPDKAVDMMNQIIKTTETYQKEDE